MTELQMLLHQGRRIMADLTIDETLMQPREIRRIDADDSGMGFIVNLECGHEIWIAVQPQSPMICGMCLEQLIHQARQVQVHQEPRERHSRK